MVLASILFEKNVITYKKSLEYLKKYGYRPIEMSMDKDYYIYKISNENIKYKYNISGRDGVYFNLGRPI
jgi:hypothetical protein